MQKSKSLLRIRNRAGCAVLRGGGSAFAGDADINLPDLTQVTFPGVGLGGHALLYLGLAICAVGALFGAWEFARCRALPVHKAMSSVSNIIWETCKTYLAQQGKFLVLLWVLIAAVHCLLLRLPAANRRLRRCHPGSLRCWASWAATAWRGSASGSTPSPTAARRLPRCRATRWRRS